MMKNVLYVDDEELNLLLFKMTFDKEYNLFTASNGQDALEILKEYDISIVFSDFRMPFMNGDQLINKIKEINSDIKCYLLTAYSKDAVLNLIKSDENIEQILHKPWKKVDLLKIIEK